MTTVIHLMTTTEKCSKTGSVSWRLSWLPAQFINTVIQGSITVVNQGLSAFKSKTWSPLIFSSPVSIYKFDLVFLAEVFALPLLCFYRDLPLGFLSENRLSPLLKEPPRLGCFLIRWEHDYFFRYSFFKNKIKIKIKQASFHHLSGSPRPPFLGSHGVEQQLLKSTCMLSSFPPPPFFSQVLFYPLWAISEG